MTSKTESSVPPYFESLKSSDLEERAKAWLTLAKDDIVFYGHLFRELKGYFLELLESGDPCVAVTAWNAASRALELREITKSELRARRRHLLETLKAWVFSTNAPKCRDLSLRAQECCDCLAHLLREGVVSKEELARAFSPFLSFPDYKVRLEKWEDLFLFLSGCEDDSSAETVKDALKGLGEHYRELLKAYDHEVRLGAWEWLDEGVVGDSSGLIPYFLELLSSPDLKVRAEAWGEAARMWKDGLIPREELDKRSQLFLEVLLSGDAKAIGNLLDSPALAEYLRGLKPGAFVEAFVKGLSSANHLVRATFWYYVGEYLDLLPADNIRERFDVFLEVLGSPYLEARLTAWKAALDMLEDERLEGLVKKEEIAKRKGELVELLEAFDPEVRAEAWYYACKSLKGRSPILERTELASRLDRLLEIRYSSSFSNGDVKDAFFEALYCLEEIGIIDSATVDKVLSEVGELE